MCRPNLVDTLLFIETTFHIYVDYTFIEGKKQTKVHYVYNKNLKMYHEIILHGFGKQKTLNKKYP